MTVALPQPRTAIDPVCGMTVVVMPDTPHLAVDGIDHWFCGPAAATHFAAGVLAMDAAPAPVRRRRGRRPPPARRGRLPRRRGHRDRAVLRARRSASRCCWRASPGSARPRRPRRWRRALAPADPAAVLRGPDRRRGAVRVELPAPAAGDPAGRVPARGAARRRPVHRGVPAGAADPAGDPARRPDAAGAADRRDRPGRRRVRGAAVRVPRRGGDHHPGAGHVHRDPAARSSC